MGQSRDVVQGFYDVFNRGDLDAAHEYVSDDVENTDPSGTLRGWEAFRQFIQAFKSASPDATLSATRWIESGDSVALEGVFSGTFTQPMPTPHGELPPNGQRFELPFAEVNEVRDGRIRSHRVYYDQLALLTALGAMPSQ